MLGLDPTGATEVVGIAISIALIAWLVGAGVHLTLSASGVRARGAALVVGMGLATSAVTVTAGHYLIGNVLVFLVPFAVASLGFTLSLAILAARGSERARIMLSDLVPTWFDGIGAAATLIILAPLIGLGAVYWTSFVNDFPNYAASADVWVADSGIGDPFLYRHPDNFGSYQLTRSLHEKPMATAVTATASLTTGTPAYELLGPLTVVSFYVLVTNLMLAAGMVFRGRTIPIAAAILIPSVSIVPMSRVHDAQIGQVLAVALLAVLIHSAMILVTTSTRLAAIAAAVCTGAVGAATLGANPTLVLGSGLTWAAVLVWMIRKERVPVRSAVGRLAAASTAAVLFSLPTGSSYLTSLRGQTSGEPGYDIPFPGPLSSIGLQSDLQSVAGTGQTLLAWGAVIGIAVLATLLIARSRAYWDTLVLIGLIVANGVFILAKVGATNYAAHKWEAVALAIAAPILLARLASWIPADRARIGAVGLCGLAVCAGAVSVQASRDVPVVASQELVDLDESRILAQLDVVNVDLKNIYQNSIAALALPADQVVLVGDAYSEASAPIGNDFVLRQSTATAWQADNVIPLTGDYVLATVNLQLRPGEPVVFDAEHPESARLLYGRWYDLEPSGVWSRSRWTRLAFDVSPELRGHDVSVTLTGTRLVSPDTPRDLIVSVSGTELARETFSKTEQREITFTVSYEQINAGDGRVVVELDAPAAVRPRDLGQPDDRTLGFQLTMIMVESASR